MKVRNGEYLLESIFLLSIFQGIHFLTFFNFYQNTCSQFEVDNFYAWAILLVVILAAANLILIRSVGFEEIKNRYYNQTERKRKKLDIIVIVYIFFTFLVFSLTI